MSQEKDIIEKTLEDYNDVFADILNVLLFKGRQVVKEEELFPAGIISQYKADDSTLHEMERDVSKTWQNCRITVSRFGIENQTHLDADMVFRVIGYEGASYRSQLLSDKMKNSDGSYSKKERYPVITLVLYFGYESHWNRRTLYEHLDIPEDLKEYVNDYKINVFEIAYLDDETINSFHSDFKIVAKVFSQLRKNRRYVPEADEIRHVDEVLKMLSVLTGDKRFKDASMTIPVKKNGGESNMIDIISEYEVRGEVKAYYKLGHPVDKIAEETGLSPDEVKEIIKSFSPVAQA